MELRPSFKASEARDSYSRAILDSLDTNVAVIDDKGVIVDVNRSWLVFALDNGVSSLDKVGSGVNYFEVCVKAHGGRSEEAPAALGGLKFVLDGSKTHFDLEYPVIHPTSAGGSSCEPRRSTSMARGT